MLDVLEYTKQPAVCSPWDPRAVEVAGLVAEALSLRMPCLRIEHVGSTAVPGCDGKGVVDLAVIYPDGMLEAARDLVDSMGFQRQRNADPFPEDRPMRTGAIEYDGKTYRLHVHILNTESDEVTELLTFRDRLRNEADLREAYIARKREVIETGTTDSLQYCYAKGGFIERTLGRSASSEPGKGS